MRLILRDALESRAACEWILECLWTVAKVGFVFLLFSRLAER